MRAQPAWRQPSVTPETMAWYRGQLGVQSKWFFYVFYPAHLLGLWALGLALN